MGENLEIKAKPSNRYSRKGEAWLFATRMQETLRLLPVSMDISTKLRSGQRTTLPYAFRSPSWLALLDQDTERIVNRES
jgi:hypothetical protein